MSGMGILLVILLVSSLPAIVVFIWFRISRYPFTFLQFILSLLAGAASFFPALFLRNFFAGIGIFPKTGRLGLFGEIFIGTALAEELSRLIMLLILFFLFRRFGLEKKPPALNGGSENAAAQDSPDRAFTAAKAAATGMIAGFGFSVFESAVLGALDFGVVLPRLFTAALLHGACGARVGVSLSMIGKGPVAGAVFRFLTAVAIHGVYNFLLVVPGILPSIAAVLVAFSALTTSVLAIQLGMRTISTDNGTNKA